MTRSNGWSNGRSNGKEDVTQVKAPVCNALIVTNENESRDLLLIKGRDGYKVRKKAEMAIMSESNSTQRFVVGSPLDETITIVHPYRRRSQLLIFCIISLAPSVGNVCKVIQFLELTKRSP